MITETKLRFSAQLFDFNNSVGILAQTVDANGHRYMVAKPVEFTMENIGDHVIKDPTFYLDFDAAQSLLDTLIESGMRPTKLANPSGEIARINDHLQDMRTLVFDQKAATLSEAVSEFKALVRDFKGKV